MSPLICWIVISALCVMSVCPMNAIAMQEMNRGCIFAVYDRPVLEPLHLQLVSSDEEESVALPPSQLYQSQTSQLICLFCDVTFSIKDNLLKHLAGDHHFVIADVLKIADLNEYLTYWKKRFNSGLALTEFCSVIQTNSKASDPDPSEFYYLLCDALPEDKQIRGDLQQMKLNTVLEQQQKEREDDKFSRDCLFCSQHVTGNRSDLFEHMEEWHHFTIGLPDNLVYVDELLEILKEKLISLKCLYCEKTFKDSNTLKEHMRKKRHKRLRASNTTYHRFFINNYLEPDWAGNCNQNKDSEDSSESDSDSCHSSETHSEKISKMCHHRRWWSDWNDASDLQAVCLFCHFSSASSSELFDHLQSKHEFHLPKITESLKLNFYQKIKLINYIRRQVHQNVCFSCLESFSDTHVLLNHLHADRHTSAIPDSSVWDQPEYFFPTYENDNLLCLICSDRDSAELESLNSSFGFTSVIMEDLPPCSENLALKQLAQLTLDNA